MKCMKDFNLIETIRTCAECGVSEITIDSVVIKFDNRENKEISNISYPAVNEEYQEDTNRVDKELQELQAEELTMLHIEDPVQYEELLANPDNLINFENQIEDY